MPASESPAHLELKRLALIWAQANGYPVAGCEVGLPNLRFRLDAAAYRPARQRILQPKKDGKARTVVTAAIGTCAVFECKANRSDLIRDCRNSAKLRERLQQLAIVRSEIEAELRLNQPSLRRGDSLWPEYETVDYDRAGHEPYRKVMKLIGTLTRQLRGQTKMENLLRWNAANLHYLVVEPNLIEDHEVPSGWGLLVRNNTRLDLRVRPELRRIPDEARLQFLHRIALAGTRAANREAGADYAAINAERRGLDHPRLLV